MTHHSTRATGPLANSSLRSRIVKKSWPLRLALVAALLLAVPLLFHAGSPVHAADKDVSGVTVTSPNPGQLSISWDTPSDAPDDYRVTWKKSSGKWPSYKNDNTVEGGNAFPTGTSHSVSGLEEGTAYKMRVRARYHDSNGNVEKSGPWSATKELTVSATPPQPQKGAKEGGGESNQGRSTNPPAKPTGLLPGASHDNVLLFWTNPDDDTITGYQVLRGDDAANLAVLTDDTGSASTGYTDDTVSASTTYAYAIRARNAHGLSPQSDPASVTTLAPPPGEELTTALATGDPVDLGTVRVGEQRTFQLPVPTFTVKPDRDLGRGFTLNSGDCVGPYSYVIKQARDYINKGVETSQGWFESDTSTVTVAPPLENLPERVRISYRVLGQQTITVTSGDSPATTVWTWDIGCFIDGNAFFHATASPAHANPNYRPSNPSRNPSCHFVVSYDTNGDYRGQTDCFTPGERIALNFNNPACPSGGPPRPEEETKPGEDGYEQIATQCLQPEGWTRY